MKSTEFKAWMKSIDRMSRNQRDKLRKKLEGKEDTDEVIALIERNQHDKLACPDCKATKLYRWGKVSELQRYRCRQCNRTFNALTGTPLARLRHKDKWFEYGQAMIQGLSIRKSADNCKIANNTSFKWRHRFLQIPATHQPSKMNGIVEVDEETPISWNRSKGNAVCQDLHASVAVKPLRKGHRKNRCLYWWCATGMVKLPTVYCMAQVPNKLSQRLSLC